MFKRAHLILILIFAALMPTKLYAVAVNDTMSGTSPICNASATLNANEDEVCRATPITYKVKIYEMGLCTAVAFNFLVTDAGVLWGDDNNSTKDQPDQFNNGPFMGYFTVLNAD
jgi:hypothetical protein